MQGPFMSLLSKKGLGKEDITQDKSVNDEKLFVDF